MTIVVVPLVGVLIPISPETTSSIDKVAKGDSLPTDSVVSSAVAVAPHKDVGI